MGCLYSIFHIFVIALYFLFGTIWGWIIILAFVLPPVITALKRKASRNTKIAHLKSNLVNKSNADARFELGTIYFAARKYARAVAMLEEAYSIRKVERKIVLALADAAIAARNPARALEVLEDAREIDLRDSKDRFFNLRGRAYLAAGRFGDAEGDFRQAIADNDSNIEARYWLARTLKARGDVAGARSQLGELKGIYSAMPPFAKKRTRRWYFRSFFV